jgi:hypothetical protein
MPDESCFKSFKKALLLRDNGLFTIELLFQDKTGKNIGQAQEALTVLQLDQIDLDVIRMFHIFILIENRKIATCG